MERKQGAQSLSSALTLDFSHNPLLKKEYLPILKVLCANLIVEAVVLSLLTKIEL